MGGGRVSLEVNAGAFRRPATGWAVGRPESVSPAGGRLREQRHIINSVTIPLAAISNAKVTGRNIDPKQL